MFLNFTKWFYTEENLKFKVVKKVKGVPFVSI